MDFEHTLNQHFLGAMEESLFVHRSAEALARHGFHRDNSIACVACCRDEISQPLHEEATRAWGLAFNNSSLAGMIFSGKTGFAAALAHAPQVDGRERYVFYAMPHVAIGPDGEAGVVDRAGRTGPSTACGALLALLGEIQNGRIDTRFQHGDIEQSLLKARIAAKLSWGANPDLFALTKIAHDVILEDLEQTIEQTVDTSMADYAVLTGIQIHGANGVNRVYPCAAYVVVEGTNCELKSTLVATA